MAPTDQLNNNGHNEGLSSLSRQQTGAGADSNWSASGGRASIDELTSDELEQIKTNSKVSATLGENVVLNCDVKFKDGQEKPFIVNWLKYPHKLPIYIWYGGYPPHVAQGYENRVARIGQASLNLSSIRHSDSGFYECKIHFLDRKPNDKGLSTYLYLDVQGESLG